MYSSIFKQHTDFNLHTLTKKQRMAVQLVNFISRHQQDADWINLSYSVVPTILCSTSGFLYSSSLEKAQESSTIPAYHTIGALLQVRIIKPRGMHGTSLTNIETSTLHLKQSNFYSKVQYARIFKSLKR